jgi:hypothetical protein
MKQITCSCESSHESVDEEDIHVSVAGDEHVETEIISKRKEKEKRKEGKALLLLVREGAAASDKDSFDAQLIKEATLF